MPVAEGQRLTDGRRAGVVDQIVCESRRGLPGATVIDVFLRLDDGPLIPIDPDEWEPEPGPEHRDGRP